MSLAQNSSPQSRCLFDSNCLITLSHACQQHDSSKELGGQISNLQSSIDKRFASQERTLSQLKDKIDKSPKCACAVS